MFFRFVFKKAHKQQEFRSTTTRGFYTEKSFPCAKPHAQAIANEFALVKTKSSDLSPSFLFQGISIEIHSLYFCQEKVQVDVNRKFALMQEPHNCN